MQLTKYIEHAFLGFGFSLSLLIISVAHGSKPGDREFQVPPEAASSSNNLAIPASSLSTSSSSRSPLSRSPRQSEGISAEVERKRSEDKGKPGPIEGSLGSVRGLGAKINISDEELSAASVGELIPGLGFGLPGLDGGFDIDSTVIDSETLDLIRQSRLDRETLDDIRENDQIPSSRQMKRLADRYIERGIMTAPTKELAELFKRQFGGTQNGQLEDKEKKQISGYLKENASHAFLKKSELAAERDRRSEKKADAVTNARKNASIGRTGTIHSRSLGGGATGLEDGAVAEIDPLQYDAPPVSINKDGYSSARTAFSLNAVDDDESFGELPEAPGDPENEGELPETPGELPNTPDDPENPEDEGELPETPDEESEGEKI